MINSYMWMFHLILPIPVNAHSCASDEVDTSTKQEVMFLMVINLSVCLLSGLLFLSLKSTVSFF